MPTLLDTPEFALAKTTLDTTLQRIEKARQDRLESVRKYLQTSETDLARVKQQALELPALIARYRAEIARLEASTADDLLREAVGGARPKTDDLPHQMLDLRTLPAGTVCEAVDVLACDGKPAGIEAGERFTIRWAEGHLLAETDVGGRYIDPVQPARVVERIKHACPRRDDGMQALDRTALATGLEVAAPPPSEWCDGSGKGGAE